MMTRKIASVLLAFLLIFAVCAPAASAADTGYTITNPYSDIDWDTINTYKTALHTHTNATDGDPTMKQSVERHTECGFDIVATTDHGTVNYSWETGNVDTLVHGVLSLVGRSEGEIVALGSEGTFDNGTSYTLATEENGDDYLTLENGSRILRVPYGIEQNAVSVNAHVNSWFVDYHTDRIVSYEDALSNVDSRGGVCVINHPGEYSKARYELHSEDAYNLNEFSYWYLVNKWANLLEKYPACLGIDINSKGDNRTRFDRILWDELLERFSANGENVFAICSSDAHQLDKIDTGFVYALMPTLDSASLKTALQKGEFFGASHCLGNPDELHEIADALNELYGENETGNKVLEAAEAMDAKVAAIENGEESADEDIGITYDVLDDNGYCEAETQPMVTGIYVDDDKDTITITSTDALIVRWISDGKLITTTKAGDATFSLADYSDEIGNYVRAEIFGEGGIIYTQAFILNAEQNAGTSSVVDKGFFDFGIFDFLTGVFNNFGDIIRRAVSDIF